MGDTSKNVDPLPDPAIGEALLTSGAQTPEAGGIVIQREGAVLAAAVVPLFHHSSSHYPNEKPTGLVKSSP